MDLKKNKIYIPEYMDLKKKQNSMYWVHESEKRFLCIAQGGGEPEQIFFLVLDKYLQHVKKILIFGIF